MLHGVLLFTRRELLDGARFGRRKLLLELLDLGERFLVDLEGNGRRGGGLSGALR